MQNIWQYIEQGMLEEAAAACAQILDVHPDHPEAEFALAVIAYNRGDKVLAIEKLLKVLSVAPDALPALNLGSKIYYETGNPAEALELARRALDLEPSDALMIQQAGHCLLALSRPFEALELFDSLILLDQAQAVGYFERARAMLDIGSTFDVIESLTIALDIAPDAIRLAKLAELESSLGRSSLALSVAQRALKEDPANISTNMIAGQSLIELGWPDEAERFWKAARAASPETWRVERQQGHVFSTCGRFKEAEGCLKKSLELEPKQGNAYQLIFSVRKADEADRALIEQMEALFSEGSLDEGEAASLAFALAKASDDLGDPERAMSFYEAANHKRMHEIESLRPFNPEAMASECTLRSEMFASAFPPQPGPATAKPIFVVGQMRSGTSLMEQILTAHPQVTGAGELDFWQGSEKLLVDSDMLRLRSERVEERRQAYLRLLDSFAPKGRVVDKNPNNILTAGLIHHVFPDAPIIHLVRNPADVALSMWMSDVSLPWVSSRKHISFVIRETMRLAEQWRNLLPKNRFLDVPYEELVQDPERWVRLVLDFCGLPWHEGCLRAHRARKNVRTVSLWQVRQPIYQSSVARWKRYEPWLGEFRDLLE